jgi:hypothetical protein
MMTLNIKRDWNIGKMRDSSKKKTLKVFQSYHIAKQEVFRPLGSVPNRDFARFSKAGYNPAYFFSFVL